MKYLLAILLAVYTSSTYTETVHHNNVNDIRCLAATIHYESKGESLKGKIAVGHVVLNRTKDERFPSSICKVVKQRGQFSWVNNMTRVESLSVPYVTLQLANDILNGKYKDPTKGSLFFHNETVVPFNYKRTVKIGNHIFYSS